MGNILAVGTGYRIHFYNLQNPENPQKYGTIISRGTKSGSSTALAKLRDGRYLLVVTATDAQPVDFYVSNEPESISSGFSWIAQVDPADSLWAAFQSLNLVTQCSSGQLYLLGTENTGLFGDDEWGDDYARLYQVNFSTSNEWVDTYGPIKNFHAYCSNDGSRQCNFDAAAGVYVSQNGTLALYAVEHDDDGPGSTKNVKFMEFWP
jgi:hypothetical protein